MSNVALALLLLVFGGSPWKTEASSDFDVLTEEDLRALSPRTFSGFNAPSLLAVVAVGAVVILLVAVGLYLYDVYADTQRTSTLRNPDYSSYYQSQYETAEQAYPYYQRRWVGVDLPEYTSSAIAKYGLTAGPGCRCKGGGRVHIMSIRLVK